MPTINVDKKDLEYLANLSLSDKLIEDKFPMMGVEVEEIFEEDKREMVQFSINPNRPDYLSIEGLARGFRGFMGIQTGLSKYDIHDSDIEVIVKSNKERPYIAFALVKNVIVDDLILESIINLQEKLHWAIGRDRKKLAIGVHDYDKIEAPFTYDEVEGDAVKFVPLAMAEAGEMTPVEIVEKHEKGQKYAHLIKSKYPLITDKNGDVLSMPPIINGELTKVTTNTKNLLIDITGTEKGAVENTLNIVATALAERRGTIYSVKVIYEEDGKVVDTKTYPNLEPIQMEIDLEFINKKLGLELNFGQVISALRKAGLDAELINKDGNNLLKVYIPAYRNDMLGKVDIVEEIAINYGYEKFNGAKINVHTIGQKNELEVKSTEIKNTMIGLGFQEVMNLTLTNKGILFDKMNLEVGTVEEGCKEYIEVLKPASIEHNVIRTSIIPQLLETLKINKHNELPQKIFEIGDCVIIDEEADETEKCFDTKCKDIRKVAGAIIQPNGNFNEIRSAIDALLREQFENYAIENYVHPSFIKGRCAKILINGEYKGLFGEINPQVIVNFELEHPITAFEIEIDN
ncbi:phenylalanine--tRNA ligase subunit beta [Methanococcus voltae]|uniref:phenylalanine--tRNA ligase subunit beta n=1 Tax=Methanococcus voltae TaxID=2188 RepID=UPI001AEA5044|nr:phenylalanine--tRNA ligase subunit beta [Methanococcus voltae]MBP2171716.1 phenylalanyl-tRNA synthetase beta chain [Methanococcus voltae]